MHTHSCMKLLRRALKLWKGGEIRFSYVDKVLQYVIADGSVLYFRLLEIINCFVKYQPKEFVSFNILSIGGMMEKCITYEKSDIWPQLTKLLKQICTKFPVVRMHV
jgi:hypothetical protein